MNVDFPLHFDTLGRTATCDTAQHVREMLEQLLFTGPGERVNRPEFGSGLLQLVFAPNSVSVAAALQFTTRAAIEQWLGDVLDLQAIEVTADGEVLRISIRYALRRTGEVHGETFERTIR